MSKRHTTLKDLRGRVFSAIARHVPRRGAAVSAATWDQQYSSGRWDHLAQLPELSRFSVLVGYLRHFKPGGSILDVGCGEGVLLDRLPPQDCGRYVGVDLSTAAIEKADQRRRPNAAFVVADAQQYVPSDTFDAVVFSEILYYGFTDPRRTVERYAQALNAGGLLMVSINTAFRGGLAILDDLKRTYAVLDETRVAHGDNRWAWVCTVLSPTA